MNPLPRSFYTRRTLTVAKELLGKYIVRTLGRKRLIGRIVETEAYLRNDPASHSYRGKTRRNAPMFERGGCLYVYFTYGLHYCANVVTAEEGIGEAVLIRAVEPIEGIDEMRKRRGRPGKVKSTLRGLSADGTAVPAELRLLTNGPAKFAQAFGLTVTQSGIDLTGTDIFLTEGIAVPKSRIGVSGRIGISTAQEKQWRFFLRENPWVSKT